MPMVVFAVGVLFRTEKFTASTGLNMVVVVTGILIASHGDWASERSR
jgi:drug/metabolite transporter (DMT)-like permease